MNTMCQHRIVPQEIEMVVNMRVGIGEWEEGCEDVKEK